jgi:periodic tryptophan protein 1
MLYSRKKRCYKSINVIAKEVCFLIPVNQSQRSILSTNQSMVRQNEWKSPKILIHAMISAVAWIPRGASKRVPDKFVLSKDEVEMMQTLADDSGEEDHDEDENADMDTDGDDAEEDEALKGLNMKDYDNEPDDVALKDYLNGEEIYDDDNEDPTLDDEKDDEGDKDDLEIRPTDAVVMVATTEENFSSLEIHVYEEDTGNLYVHHEINLPAFPLSLAWMDMAPVPPQDGTVPVNGSFVAVGTFKSGIEIWNLDILDVLEPTATLGGEDNAPLR